MPFKTFKFFNLRLKNKTPWFHACPLHLVPCEAGKRQQNARGFLQLGCPGVLKKYNKRCTGAK